MIWNDFTLQGMSMGQLILGFSNGDLEIYNPLDLTLVNAEEQLFEEFGVTSL